MTKKEYGVVIVGAGPAGAATAIRLAHQNPDLASRSLLVEKCVFPRMKLCAGGVTRHADDLLRVLGVQVDVPSFPVHAIRLVFQELEFTLPWRNAFRVVRREEFDTRLARAAADKGVELHEGETVRDLVWDEEGVTVVTDRGEYRTLVVVGADGANSVVRKKLGLVRWDRISRLLEVLAPVDAERTFEFAASTATFDFTPILRGVQGYVWHFPSFKQGRPTLNVGLYDGRVNPERPLADLKPEFEERMRVGQISLAGTHLMGHPERWFDPHTPHSVPRVLLAGDAAGVEPLLGEGISHALDFGITVADAVSDAFGRQDFTFRGYNQRLSRSGLGRRLRLKRAIARFLYSDHPRWRYRLAWRIGRAVLG